jgi:hypothetical protein
MSNDISIFKNRDVAVAGKKAPSALTQSLMKAGSKLKRISPRNGMFVRVVNGDVAGKLKPPLRVVLVGVAQANAQRQFYIKSYDPNAEATAPDCWSNDGNKPDASIKAPQGKTCETCPQNVKGSGSGNTRACRFERRVAVILPDEVGGNNHGDIYQMKFASKSIFGKGAGQVFPLNAYIDYVIANGENIDGVITEVTFNEDNDNQSVLFRAVDFVAPHPELQDAVNEAVASPEAQKAVVLTVAAVDKGEGGANEDFETAKKPVTKAATVEVEEEEAPVAEPTKRASKKAAPPPAETKSLADVVSAWSDDEE